MFDTYGAAVEALFSARFRVEKLHAYFTKCQINWSASHIHHRFLLKQSAIILRAIKTSANDVASNDVTKTHTLELVFLPGVQEIS